MSSLCCKLCNTKIFKTEHVINFSVYIPNIGKTDSFIGEYSRKQLLGVEYSSAVEKLYKLYSSQQSFGEKEMFAARIKETDQSIEVNKYKGKVIQDGPFMTVGADGSVYYGSRVFGRNSSKSVVYRSQYSFSVLESFYK